MSADQLRIDAFVRAFETELREALELLAGACEALAAGAPVGGVCDNCRQALEGLAGSCSFVGRDDIETRAVHWRARLTSPCDAAPEALQALLREALADLQGCQSAGGPRLATAPGIPASLPAPLPADGWSDAEQRRFATLLRATFDDLDTALDRPALFDWADFVDEVYRLDFAPLWRMSGEAWLAVADVRVDRPQARPLLAWLLRLGQALRRITAANPAVRYRGRLSADAVTYRMIVDLEGATPQIPLPLEPYGLEAFGGRTRIRKNDENAMQIELFLPRVLPLASVRLLRHEGHIFAVININIGILQIDDFGGKPSQGAANAGESDILSVDASLCGASLGIVRPMGRHGDTLPGVLGVMRQGARAVPLLRALPGGR